MQQSLESRLEAIISSVNADQMIAEFEPNATDAELTSLGETRTARAFMLLGRVAGTFD